MGFSPGSDGPVRAREAAGREAHVGICRPLRGLDVGGIAEPGLKPRAYRSRAAFSSTPTRAARSPSCHHTFTDARRRFPARDDALFLRRLMAHLRNRTDATLPLSSRASSEGPGRVGTRGMSLVPSGAHPHISLGTVNRSGGRVSAWIEVSIGSREWTRAAPGRTRQRPAFPRWVGEGVDPFPGTSRAVSANRPLCSSNRTPVRGSNRSVRKDRPICLREPADPFRETGRTVRSTQSSCFGEPADLFLKPDVCSWKQPVCSQGPADLFARTGRSIRANRPIYSAEPAGLFTRTRRLFAGTDRLFARTNRCVRGTNRSVRGARSVRSRNLIGLFAGTDRPVRGNPSMCSGNPSVRSGSRSVPSRQPIGRFTATDRSVSGH